MYRLIFLFASLFLLMSQLVNASASSTTRIPHFSNDKVSAWETIIYPSAN